MNMNASIRATALVAAATAVALAGACAKPFSPPGGDQDRTPPRLVSSSPAALAIVTDLGMPLTLTFDETLAERGVNEASIAVSPQPRGKVHVDRKGERIEVSVDGGWAADQVYRVILQPGVTDRFGNARKEPVEIIFSTGPPIQNTAFAGLIMDRLTGRSRAADGAIEAIRRGDSAVYTVSADTGGFFALRSVPAGVYDVRAFGDLNRNRRLDSSEPSSASRQVALSANDTIDAVFIVLPMDTTPPRLVRAEAQDSTHVLLTFEDPIDPENGLTSQSVALVRAADSVSHGGTVITQLKNIWQRTQVSSAPPATPAAVRDTGAAAMRDTTAAVAVPPRPRPPAGRAQPGRLAADTVSLPDREVVLTVGTPLVAGARYRVTVTDVRNVNGLVGGGSVEFVAKPTPR